MTAVEELAYRIQTGNIDPTRGAAILERACADAVDLAAKRFEAALEALTTKLTSDLAVPDLERACAQAHARIEAAITGTQRSAGS